MAKTLAQIQLQIRKLEDQAKAIRDKEIHGVVARIKEAISHYGLTDADLFGSTPDKAKVKVKAPSKKMATPEEEGAPGKVVAAKKRGPVAAKYRDAEGNTWSGRGNRPRWLVSALHNGKKIEDFVI